MFDLCCMNHRIRQEEGVRLAQLEAGAIGEICAVDIAGDDADRLLAMGFCRGRRVQVLKCGNPMIVSVMGSRIGIHRELAAGLSVRVLCFSNISGAGGEVESVIA